MQILSVPDNYFFAASLGSKLRTISFHILCFSLGSLNGSQACVALIALSEMDLNTGSSLAFIIVGASETLPSGFRRKRTFITMPGGASGTGFNFCQLVCMQERMV